MLFRSKTHFVQLVAHETGYGFSLEADTGDGHAVVEQVFELSDKIGLLSEFIISSKPGDPLGSHIIENLHILYAAEQALRLRSTL